MKIIHKKTKAIFVIYGTMLDDQTTYFLIFTGVEFQWVNSRFFEPYEEI